MNSLIPTIFTLQAYFPTLFSHMSCTAPAVNQNCEFFDSSCDSNCDEGAHQPCLIIDDDDEDLIGYKLVKKQKANNAEAHKVIPQQNRSRFHLPAYNEVAADHQPIKQALDSRSALYDELLSSLSAKSFAPDFSALCKTLHPLSNTNSAADTQIIAKEHVSFGLVSCGALYNGYSQLQQDMTELNLKSMSSTSTDEGSPSSQASDANEAVAMHSTDVEEDDMKYGWESPILKIDIADEMFDEIINNNAHQTPFASIPAFNINTVRGGRVKRTLKPIWKPDCIEPQLIMDCLSRLSDVLHQSVTNEEKAVKLLVKHNMSLDNAMKEVLKNKTFYRNHFKSDQRVLRGRALLF